MSDLGYITSNSAEIRAILNEPDTVFLVFTSPSDAQIQPLYNDALDVIKANNPAVWRVLWVKKPKQVDKKLAAFFWPSGVSQAVVMSLGRGLDREVKASYAAGVLTGAFDLFEAFSQG
jgi:hypothetical protein